MAAPAPAQPSLPYPCFHNLLQEVKANVGNFAADEHLNAVLPPLFAAVLEEQRLKDGSSEDFQHLLTYLGYNTATQTFTTAPPNPSSLVSLLKAHQLATLHVVGEGAYSFVYKAIDKLTGQYVMLKMMRTENGGGGYSREGLSATTVREMSLLRELNGSPFIVKLLDVLYDHRQRIYLVMEHLDTDLSEYFARNPDARHPQAIKRYMYQLISGIAYAHSHRVLHRDIKPSNILLDKKSNTIKVADFGLSRTFLPNANRAYTLEVVTLLYRAPELLLGCRTYTTAIDVWSIGCIFGEMVLGQPFFFGDSAIGQLYEIFNLLGTPHEIVWPGLMELPEWQPVFPQWRAKSMAEKVPSSCAEGVELLSSMLRIDPSQRISCKEALQHPYFDDIRVEMQQQQQCAA